MSDLRICSASWCSAKAWTRLLQVKTDVTQMYKRVRWNMHTGAISIEFSHCLVLWYLLMHSYSSARLLIDVATLAWFLP